MTSEQILKKAIEKAVKGGWDDSWSEQAIESLNDDYTDPPHPSAYWWIFSKPFAKCFFTPKPCYVCKKPVLNDNEGKGGCLGWEHAEDKDEVWQYHLQTMVLKKDPIKYLEGFI